MLMKRSVIRAHSVVSDVVATQLFPAADFENLEGDAANLRGLRGLARWLFNIIYVFMHATRFYSRYVIREQLRTERYLRAAYLNKGAVTYTIRHLAESVHLV